MLSRRLKKIKTGIFYCVMTCLALSACTPNSVEQGTLTSSDKMENTSSQIKSIIPSQAVKVARITGATPDDEPLPNPNKTDSNYQVNGTDLGILWDAGDNKVMAAFGDTFGQGWMGPGGNGADWRSNVLGISSDKDLKDGLILSSMITETAGLAKQIIDSDHDTSGYGDFTAIPTAGISVGTRNFIHYMDVKAWGSPGYWYTNYSEIVYSDDGGQNWVKSGVKWSGESNFAQAAFVKSKGYVYMLGTTSGRQGNINIARVPEKEMLSIGSYQYWDGHAWQIGKESAAVPIVQGPAGELSVQYNSHFKRWIMCYLSEPNGAIVMRDAVEITGPWSDEKVVVSSADYPGLYGSFIHPWTNNGTDLYFTMSQWDPYNVFLMHAKLSEK